jgi:hypothetical protein
MQVSTRAKRDKPIAAIIHFSSQARRPVCSLSPRSTLGNLVCYTKRKGLERPISSVACGQNLSVKTTADRCSRTYAKLTNQSNAKVSLFGGAQATGVAGYDPTGLQIGIQHAF